MSGAEIRRKLLNDQKIKKEQAPTPAPSDRAIRRAIADFKRARPEEQDTYRYFSWPASMESGVLPWEASRSCLDLLAECTRRGKQPPLNSVAQAFWQVTQAAPDVDIQKRMGLAVRLVIFKKLERSMEIGRIERYLAEQRWKGKSRLPDLELTKEQVAAVDLYAELENYSLIDLDARRWVRRMKRGNTQLSDYDPALKLVDESSLLRSRFYAATTAEEWEEVRKELKVVKRLLEKELTRIGDKKGPKQNGHQRPRKN